MSVKQRIVVCPANSEKNWFKEHLSEFAQVRFCLEEAALSVDSDDSAHGDVQAQLADCDLVVYRRMRAQKMFPTQNPYLCFEWSPLRHPLSAWHYYIDSHGFSCESQAVPLFRNLSGGQRAQCHSTGSELTRLYESAVHGRTMSIIDEYVLKKSAYAVLVILQVPSDDVLQYFSGLKSGADPHAALISHAENRFQGKADIFVKPHPAFPRVSDAGKRALRTATVIDPYCPILPLLKLVDLVVTINSSCALEALILGTPVITLGDSTTSMLEFSYSAHDAMAAGTDKIPLPPSWQRDGQAFLGFLSESYGDWFPSPRLLHQAVSTALGAGVTGD